jgi:hypothetical protein
MTIQAQPQVQAQDALSAEDLSKQIFQALEPYVVINQGGHLSVARDPLDIIELLGEGAGTFRVIIAWNGEKPQGHKYSGIVEHEWRVVISQNRGLPHLSGSGLFLGRNDGAPTLVAQASRVRELLRSLRFPDRITEKILTYAGTEADAVNGQLIDSFTQTWRLIAALPPAANK